jgi:hypothetical protein
MCVVSSETKNDEIILRILQILLHNTFYELCANLKLIYYHVSLASLS